MTTSNNFRHNGSALLGTVLLAFILLAILSGIIFRMASQTKKIELWQMDDKRQQLTLVARSAVNIVAEYISDDADILQNIESDNPSSEITIKEKSGGAIIAKLTLAVSADAGSIVTITATAKTSDDVAQKISITGRYNKDSHKIIRWVTSNEN